MSPSEDQDQDGEKKVSREERLEKIRQLISARGEDAAKVLKMWLAQSQEEANKKREQSRIGFIRGAIHTIQHTQLMG